MIGRGETLNDERAGCPKRPARFSLRTFAFAIAAISPLAQAPAVEPAERPAFASQAIEDFYSARAGRPLWLAEGHGAAAASLMEILRSAEADGLDPGNYLTEPLAKAMRAAWGGSPAMVRKADILLSQAFVAYVRDLKTMSANGLIWVDPQLTPAQPGARALLDKAAAAPSLDAWVRDMGWMHPIYAGIRRRLASQHGGPADHVLRLNLERARALPAGKGRYVVVNATAQRLAMYEDGREVDSMKVVVGKPKNPTPMMAALIRFAALNPFWYVPPDLAAERIAPNVLKDGLAYLRTHGYQVMANWNDDSTVIDPATIDWQAVADGRKQVWIRQSPGPGNSMGQMKFMFPNDQGIYLHDTPQKELMAEPARMFSGGCVRLEDAPRLARWLFGRPLEPDGSRPELRVDLPEPVPVYITYLTVVPSGNDLATYPDIYGRDRDQLAGVGAPPVAAR
jgi:murein L,D-transpeptidase YcbB/YkuD